MTTETVTAKSNKDVILKAYKAEMKKRKELEAERIQTRDKSAENAMSWDGVTADELDQRVEQLRAGAIDSFASLRADLAAGISELKSLNEAIESRTTELEQTYGIETEAGALAALIDARKAKEIELSERFEAEKASLNESLNAMRAQAASEKEALEAEFARVVEQHEQMRERETDEWAYNFERQKRLQKDQLADELAASRRDEAQRLETIERGLQDRIDAVTDRELEAEKLSKEVEALKVELDDVRAGHAAAVEAVVQETLKSAERTKGAALHAQKTELGAEITVLRGEVKSMTRQLEEATGHNIALTTKLEAAYEKINAVAMQSLDASRANAEIGRLDKLATEAAKGSPTKRN